jgi:hypothetical protein
VVGSLGALYRFGCDRVGSMTYIRTDGRTDAWLTRYTYTYIHMAGVRFDWLRYEMNEGNGMEGRQVRKRDDRFGGFGRVGARGGKGRREKGRGRGRGAERVHKRGSRAE